MMPDLAQDSIISPEETPFEDFLNTPLIDDDDFDTSPMLPLFPDFEEPEEDPHRKRNTQTSHCRTLHHLAHLSVCRHLRDFPSTRPRPI
jgi:hypothetical protein